MVKDLETYRLDEEEVRVGMFTTGWFPFKYSWFISVYCCLCHEKMCRYGTKTGWQVFPDKMVTVKGKTS